MRRPSRHVLVLLVVALALIVTTLSACSAKQGGSSLAVFQAPSGADGTADAAAADGAALAGGQAAPQAGGSASSTKTLPAQDAKAIEAQLNAIERELDSLGMPSDADFKGIEDSLK